MNVWTEAYRALHRSGLTDLQIGKLAGISRVVVNRVRKGTYKFEHEPRFAGGVRVKAAVAKLVNEGVIEKDPWHEAASAVTKAEVTTLLVADGHSHREIQLCQTQTISTPPSAPSLKSSRGS